MFSGIYFFIYSYKIMQFNTQQILVPFYGKTIPFCALKNAIVLARGFQKEVCLCAMSDSWQKEKMTKSDVVINSVSYTQFQQTDFVSIVNCTDAIMVVWSDEDRISLNNQLKLCKDLRIPYLFVSKLGLQLTTISKAIVPVGFLMEEKEKGPWANSFGKFFNTEILLLEPLDRGSKAQKNSKFLQRLLLGFKQPFSVIKGKKNSFKIEKEGVLIAEEQDAEIVFITASRDYGLDDLFFGTKEYHILRKSKVPVMVLNPRGDIYVLCGN